MQATLMSVLLRFHGSQPREATPPNGHRRINGEATEICAEASPERKTKKADAAGKLISVKRGTGTTSRDSDAEPVEGLQPSEAVFVAAADAEAWPAPVVVARPAADAAPGDLPDHAVVTDVAVAAAPRPPAPPSFVRRTATPRDSEMNSFSFAPMTGRQINVLLKHADELEKVMRRNDWQRELTDARRKISESLKTKLCAEAARKEKEARAKRLEARRDVHRVLFTFDKQPSEFVISEE